MSKEDDITPSKKLVSIRIRDSHRNSVQQLASRLLVKESKLYRLAINILLSKLKDLQHQNLAGSDLLPLFLNLRGQFTDDLDLKPLQLFRVINRLNADPNKFVALNDVELLLTKEHLLRERLMSLRETHPYKDTNTDQWLQNYLLSRYSMLVSIEPTSSEH